MDNSFKTPGKPVLLVIMDGVGVNPSKQHNAWYQANTPNLDNYFSRFSHTAIQASGNAVGLPDGQMGNSEVGHMTIGSGMVIKQDLVLIDDAIKNRTFYSNETLRKAAKSAKEKQRPVHLIGLVSDGGVHSHINHLYALIELCKREGAIPNLHLVTDGRDTSPKSILRWLDDLQTSLQNAGGAIATVSGRYYTMDRDKRWERTEQAWQCMVHGKGLTYSSAREAIEQSYERGENDEFIQPCILHGAQTIENEDEIIVFNFRKDRPRQIVSSLYDESFSGFDRGSFTRTNITCMMEYDAWFGLPYAFTHDHPQTTLSRILCESGLRQFHCAETEKYAHVTFFFNGGKSELVAGENHVIIDSPKVATYDLQPEMSAKEVADTVIEAIAKQQFDFIVVNFANGDMVGHTGIMEAAIVAVETLDREIGRVLDAACSNGYSSIVTADHGNCDEMVDVISGEPHTQHTTYPVPCLIVDDKIWQMATMGGLQDIAPTVMHLMGLQKPSSMTGSSLLLQPVARSMLVRNIA